MRVIRIWDEEGHYIYGVEMKDEWYAPGENWLAGGRYEEEIGVFESWEDIPKCYWKDFPAALKKIIEKGAKNGCFKKRR